MSTSAPAGQVAPTPTPGTGPAATGAAVAATGVVPLAAGGVAAGSIVAAMVAFLALLHETHERWLLANLGQWSSSSSDIAAAIASEMTLDQIFAQNSADRLAAGLPGALAIKDPSERAAAVRALLDTELRYARQHEEAMAARAIAAVQRSQLRRDSPSGAWWRKGFAKDPTPGCVFMAGGAAPGSVRFWPWAVLDRVHPPRHIGCPDSLHGFGDGVANGWGGAGSIPDTRDAIRAAAGIVMEEEEAQAVERELELREMLAERGIDTAAIPWTGIEEAVA